MTGSTKVDDDIPDILFFAGVSAKQWEKLVAHLGIQTITDVLDSQRVSRGELHDHFTARARVALKLRKCGHEFSILFISE